MRISIIIPIYNASKYISRCLDSVSNQTYDNSRIECLLINDNTPDDSVELIHQYLDNYNGDIQFIIINHNNNKGVSEARNTGIRNAKGDFIFFMDSDDYITVDCIEKLVEASRLYPKADMIVGNSVNQINKSIHHDPNCFLYYESKKQILNDILMFIFTGYSWNRLVKTHLIKDKCLYFNPLMGYNEDLFWNIDIALNISAIVYIPNITYSYENNTGSIMTTLNQDTQKIFVCEMELIKKVKTIKTIESENELHLFIAHYVMHLLSLKNLSTVQKKEIKNERTALVKSAFAMKKISLLMYDCLLYNPLHKLTELKTFKHNYIRLKFFILRLAKR